MHNKNDEYSSLYKCSKMDDIFTDLPINQNVIKT